MTIDAYGNEVPDDQYNWGDDSTYTGDESGWGWNGPGQGTDGYMDSGFDWSGVLNGATNFVKNNQGLLTQLYNSFFKPNSPNGQNPQGGQQQGGMSPANGLLGSLLGYLGSGAQASTYRSAWDSILNADPWNRETGKYQGLLYDAATRGIGDTAYGRSIADQVARQSSAKGYNMSGNMLHDIAQGLNQGTTNYMQALTPLAMGRAPDTRGLAPLAGGLAQTQAGQYNSIGQGVGASGSALSDFMKNWNSGPSSNPMNGVFL